MRPGAASRDSLVTFLHQVRGHFWHPVPKDRGASTPSGKRKNPAASSPNALLPGFFPSRHDRRLMTFSLPRVSFALFPSHSDPFPSRLRALLDLLDRIRKHKRARSPTLPAGHQGPPPRFFPPNRLPPSFLLDHVLGKESKVRRLRRLRFRSPGI